MSGLGAFTDEASSGKVAAIFATEAGAEEIAARLRENLQLSDAQVQVVRPGERAPGRKLEPESHAIFRTMIRAHARLAVWGAVAGAAAFGLFWLAGIAMIVNSPILAAMALVALGIVSGLMLGGLVTLRPDHDPYILKVFTALGEGRWAVVVHALSSEQRKQALDLLAAASGEVVSSLD